ncbi:uncharacterized protein [Triticum aestivum]|uniref:uncharacterized protein n=1 Tax=Triticum aestivum TaxID=4565 RepID=UPI001D0110D5|nr:uncharacterized protein LOC123106827 [Triticum aestivum]
MPLFSAEPLPSRSPNSGHLISAVLLRLGFRPIAGVPSSPLLRTHARACLPRLTSLGVGRPRPPPWASSWSTRRHGRPRARRQHRPPLLESLASPRALGSADLGLPMPSPESPTGVEAAAFPSTGSRRRAAVSRLQPLKSCLAAPLLHASKDETTAAEPPRPAALNRCCLPRQIVREELARSSRALTALASCVGRPPLAPRPSTASSKARLPEAQREEAHLLFAPVQPSSG